GFATTLSYDANDNVETLTDPLGGQVSYTYDEEDNPLTITDANGHTTTTRYNPVGLPLRIADPLGYVTRFEYDPAYNLVKVIDAQDRPTLYDYDPLQRLIRETNPLGNMTLYKRDALGRVTEMADANGHVTGYGYDGLSRLTGVTDALHNLTGYGYDPVGNLTTITDTNTHTTTFAYDLRDQLIAEVNPLGHTWGYGYDIVGNLVRRVDAEEQVTLYSYDPNDRLIGLEYPDSSTIRFAYDLDGNETEMCDWLGCASHTYDPLGRRDSTTDWLGRTIHRAYDPVGNLTGLTYPNGYRAGYAYNANDWLTGLTDPHGDTSAYERNPLGQVTRLSHPNNTVASFTYDLAGRLTSLDNRKLLAAQPHSAYAYALDKVGNRTQVIETRAAFDGSATPVVLTHTYDYDALNRLTNAATDAPESDTAYTFDGVGNRLDKSGTVLAPDSGTPELPVAPRPEAVSSTYNAANQLTAVSGQQSAVSLDYDRNGNRTRETEVLTTEGKTLLTAYRYDFENRLVGVTKSTNSIVTMEATYTYDGYGRRVKKQISKLQSPVSSLQITYLYDGLDIIGAQLEQSGATIETYYYLAPSPLTGLRRPLAMEQLSNGDRYWYQTDGLDSIVALTNETGKLVSPFLYDEYGQILAGDTDLQIFTYTAQDYDPETGLHHFYARYYDPARGVWLSQDYLKSSRILNRYLYSTNNPVTKFDILGFVTDQELNEAINDYRNKKADSESLKSTIDKTSQDNNIPWQALKAEAEQRKLEAEEEANKWYNRLLGLSDDYREIASSYDQIIQDIDDQITKSLEKELKSSKEKRDKLVDEMKRTRYLFYGCTAYSANNFEVTWRGHAYQWATNAESQGYIVDSNPQEGSVAVWEYGAGREYGHVAIVSEVKKDKDGNVLSITVNEGDYWSSTGATAGAGQWYTGNELNKVNTSTISGKDLNSILYIHTLEP
ncbi:MAG TPA: RHS repeat-associated core domain-containing protein, partial [Anaerolineae bacterium]